MQQLPQDPYSTLATTLIESQNRAPTVEKVHASETSFGAPAQTTLNIDITVKYQNRVFKANNYVFPYAQEELEHPEFIFDNAETKQGTEGVCTFINTKLADFIKGKELPLSKAQLGQIGTWANRMKQKAG
jgi:hypothetical protein